MAEIKFHELVLTNFLAFTDPVRWRLADQGLVCIIGENVDSDAASSNGAGKSSLLEGLVWTLWGQTTRGLTADAVINRRVGRNCSGQLRFVRDATTFTVTRYRKDQKLKNDLHLSSQTGPGASIDLTGQTVADTQAVLDHILGIDFDTFIRGPMMPKGSFKRFSQMTDGEAKAVLEQAVQIDSLAAAAERARTRLAERQLAETQLRAEVGRLDDLLQRLHDQWTSYQQRHDNFNNEVAADLSRNQDRQTELQQRIANLKQVVPTPDVTKARQAHERLKELARQLRASWNGKSEAAHQAWRQASVAESVIEAKLRELDDERDRLGQLRLQVECPTCLQPVDADHVADVLLLQQKQYDDVAAQLAQAQQESWEAAQVVEQVAAQAKAANERAELRVAEAADRFRQAELVQLRQQQQAAERQHHEDELAQLEAAAEKLRTQVSPFADLIQQVAGQVAETETKLATANADLTEVAEEIRYLTFWRTGFGNAGLKSFILRSVTPYMNQQAAHYAERLAGGELLIEFTTQTTLKSGQVRDQFGVLVQNRNGADTYAGNSDGEKARADLIINLVLADVVRARSQQSFPQRFYDEPMEGLDEVGVESVLGLLHDMAAGAGSIFVITHNTQMQGQFNRILRVVKRGGRSTIEV